MTVLADYRTDVGNLLATAVDASTWTTALIDQALRMAVNALDGQLVYESDFTVVTTGYEQDLSGITDIRNLSALAYPWQEGYNFGECLARWRLIDVNVVYFEWIQPQEDDIIRVRHTKLHTIEDLDSATATTVPERDRPLIGLWAAAFACDLRIRQISENPAIPKEASRHLTNVATQFRRRATDVLSQVPPLGRVHWGTLGL